MSPALNLKDEFLTKIQTVSIERVNRFELTCEPLCTVWASGGDASA